MLSRGGGLLREAFDRSPESLAGMLQLNFFQVDRHAEAASRLFMVKMDDNSAASAFDAFYAAEFGRLAGGLRLACGGDERVGEELAQEAMVRAWANWKHVQTMERPAGWLYMTGFNLVRRRWRESRRSAPDVGQRDQVEAAGSRLDLESALSRLPLQQRKAVIARHVLGFTTEETAELLSISPEALRAVLHRGVTALRRSPALASIHR